MKRAIGFKVGDDTDTILMDQLSNMPFSELFVHKFIEYQYPKLLLDYLNNPKVS
mgnify:CR=1 FL=1